MNVLSLAKRMMPPQLPRLLGMKPKAFHICALNRNVGDNALILAIREMLCGSLRTRHMEILNNSFNADQMFWLRRGDLIIFGGGGLLHSYGMNGSPLERTGTLWNITLKDLESLDMPIVLYGTGFNHFYGEPPPLPQMGEFFRILEGKGALIGFRNDGSRERFLTHFPQFESVIRTIPDPGVFFRTEPCKAERPYVVLQVAADRMQLRFGERFDEFRGFIRTLISRIEEDVVLIPHTPDDERLYRDLGQELGVSVWPLKNGVEHTAEVIGAYAGARYTISTRGHSQICSVGNRVPTFAISTHPKVEAFAEECGLGRWCYRFDREPIADGLERFDTFLREQEQIRDLLTEVNARFDAEITAFNDEVRRLVRPYRPPVRKLRDVTPDKMLLPAKELQR